MNSLTVFPWLVQDILEKQPPLRLQSIWREGSLAFACAQAWEDDEVVSRICLAFPRLLFNLPAMPELVEG